MLKFLLFVGFFWLPALQLTAQDTLIHYEGKIIQLKEVVVRSNVNVPSFMQRLKDDTSFYKAFKNLRILKFNAINDVRMLDQKGRLKASSRSKSRQYVNAGCRHTEITEEQVTGDFYTNDGKYNYYTASLYDHLFFSKTQVCGETNVVKGSSIAVNNKRGIERHKEQLKMLFFQPGTKIPGVPFIGNKVAFFDKDVSPYYDFTVDLSEYLGENCYVFRAKAKSGLSKSEQDLIVIDEMNTWFAVSDLAIRGRTYHMSYNAGIYDFDVEMEVQMIRFNELTVPAIIRYIGNWDVLFKKRERGVFTALLSDFSY